MSRTIYITIVNNTNTTLAFQNPQSSEGPKATANQSSVSPLGSIIVEATNNSGINGGNKGTFQLNGGNLSYTIFYTHPQTTGSSYVQLQSASAGGVAGIGQPAYSGDPIYATMELYQGVKVISDGSTPGWAVPLMNNPYLTFDNCQDFANSMFGPNMRASVLVTGAYQQSTTPYQPADYSGGQIGRIVSTLYDAWTQKTGPDLPILNFLANYIAPGDGQTPMTMWVPDIAYKSGTSPSAYTITGYKPFGLAQNNGNGVTWNQQNLQTFLTLLVGGAHFVAISATADFVNQGVLSAPSRPLYTFFQNSGLTQREDSGNSHYDSGTYNNTGYYYLNITGDWAPQNCGLILSLLIGSTINNSRNPPAGSFNTFMQLEGWPWTVTSGGRHKADYEAYNATLWNTATYGACPYSEKRATTVFLAPMPWTPTIYQTTLMMPYVGAYASGKYPSGKPQSWLDTSVAQVPSGTQPLPSQYYG